jgi:hypothetical protein
MTDDLSATHCSKCGAEYVNVQHPMKPPGVIMGRACRCPAIIGNIELNYSPPHSPTGSYATTNWTITGGTGMIGT